MWCRLRGMEVQFNTTLSKVLVPISRLALLSVLAATSIWCQEKPDFECGLYKIDLPKGSTEETFDRKPFQKFGEFKIFGSNEEERINKYFRVPKTRWYAVVSMFTSDESLPERGSLNWELSFSRTPRRSIFKSPAYASSESTYNTFDINRVYTFVTLGTRRMLVMLQCENPKNAPEAGRIDN